MKLKEKITDKLKNSPLMCKIIEDYGYRTITFFVCALVVNIIIAILNAVTAILYRSLWFGSFAVYYIALSMQRGSLLIAMHFATNKNVADSHVYQRSTTKIFLVNGIVLILLDLVLTFATIQIATTEKPIKIGMILAIANAVYAFGKITMAIINIVRVRKLHDNILLTMRNINLADACVSILVLTSTLICTFGSITEMREMLVAVSVGTSASIISIGIAMVIIGCKKLRQHNLLHNQ